MTFNPWLPPASNDDFADKGRVSVTVSSKLVRRINSPVYTLVAALTGVSITFMPLALLGLGINNDWNVFTVGAAIVCWLIGYLVPLFYVKTAAEVIVQVYRKPLQHNASCGK